MIPYSRPKRSDLYPLSQSKLLENHTLHSGTYTHIAHIWQYPPPLPFPPPRVYKSPTWQILEFFELTPSCWLTFRPNIRATEAGSSKNPSINTVTMEGISPWTPRSVLSILNKYWGRFPAITSTGKLTRLPSSNAGGLKSIESGSWPENVRY